MCIQTNSKCVQHSVEANNLQQFTQQHECRRSSFYALYGVVFVCALNEVGMFLCEISRYCME